MKKMKKKKAKIKKEILLLGILFTIVNVLEATWIKIDMFSYANGIINGVLFGVFILASKSEEE